MLNTKRSGLTLTEVLVAVAISAILLGMVVPAILQGRERAQQIACLNNMRQLALALHAHHQTKGTMPPYATKDSEIAGGWWIQLMSFAGEQNLYQKIMKAAELPPKYKGKGWLPPEVLWQDGIRDAQPTVLQCAADPSRSIPDPLSDSPGFWGTTNYLANWYAWGDGSGCYGRPQRFRDIRDGVSNCVAFAEGYAQCGDIPRRALQCCELHNFGITADEKPSDDPSYLPKDYTMFQIAPLATGSPAACDGWRSQTPHVRMPLALLDGSVRTVSAGIQASTWTHLLTPRDGEPIGEEW